MHSKMEYGGKGTKQDPKLKLVKGIRRDAQDRLGNCGNDGSGDGGPDHDLVESAVGLGGICPIATQKIAGSQIDQNQTNDARPNQIAGAKNISKQSGGGHFDRQ